MSSTHLLYMYFRGNASSVTKKTGFRPFVFNYFGPNFDYYPLEEWLFISTKGKMDFVSRLKSKLQKKITNDSRGEHTFQNRYKVDKENIRYQRHLNVKLFAPVNDEEESNSKEAPSTSTSILTTIITTTPLPLYPTPLVNVTQEETEFILPALPESDTEIEERLKVMEDIQVKDEPNSSDTGDDNAAETLLSLGKNFVNVKDEPHSDTEDKAAETLLSLGKNFVNVKDEPHSDTEEITLPAPEPKKLPTKKVRNVQRKIVHVRATKMIQPPATLDLKATVLRNFKTLISGANLRNSLLSNFKKIETKHSDDETACSEKDREISITSKRKMKNFKNVIVRSKRARKAITYQEYESSDDYSE